MKRSLNYSSVVVLFAALLLWGSGAFYAFSAEAAEKSKLVVRLDFIVGGKHVPWFVARAKGFYSKRGLSVDLQAGKGSADTVPEFVAANQGLGYLIMQALYSLDTALTLVILLILALLSLGLFVMVQVLQRKIAPWSSEVRQVEGSF